MLQKTQYLTLLLEFLDIPLAPYHGVKQLGSTQQFITHCLAHHAIGPPAKLLVLQNSNSFKMVATQKLSHSLKFICTSIIRQQLLFPSLIPCIIIVILQLLVHQYGIHKLFYGALMSNTGNVHHYFYNPSLLLKPTSPKEISVSAPAWIMA